jgi:hypothetical protein
MTADGSKALNRSKSLAGTLLFQFADMSVIKTSEAKTSSLKYTANVDARMINHDHRII